MLTTLSLELRRSSDISARPRLTVRAVVTLIVNKREVWSKLTARKSADDEMKPGQLQICRDTI